MYEVECLTYDENVEEQNDIVYEASCDPFLGACHPDE